MSEEQSTPKMARLGNKIVPRVGLGCMGMSEFYGASDEKQNLHVLARSFELGYRHYDTADMYGSGENEKLLGRFLRTVPRDQVFVATKFGIVREQTGTLGRSINTRPEYVKEACERSLSRLGLDTIDLYYMHRRDHSTPIEDTVGALADLVAQGKIQTIGLSEVSVETLRRAHAVHPVAAVQTEYSLLTRDPEDGLLQACAELGVSFVAYSPLSRGLLSPELDVAQLRSQGDVRQFMPRFTGANLEHNARLATELRSIADQTGHTVAQLAIAWVLAQGPHIHTIPGTRTEKYLINNFEAGRVQLTAEQLSRVATSVEHLRVAGERYPAAAMHGIGG